MRSFIQMLLLSLSLSLGLTHQARADDLPREVVINGVEFIQIPEGWFWYAVGGGYWKDTSRLKVPWYRDVKTWLDGFYIAKYEARARDLVRFLNSGQAKYASQYGQGDRTLCAVRQRPDGAYYLAEPELDLPASQLSWQLADEFARWMGFRLPSEAEWEKAARGTDKRIWPWGNEHPDDTFAQYNTNSDCQGMPVDYFRNGISPYGVYNMAGNAMEFVADWFNEDFDVSMKDGQRNPPLATHGTLGNGDLNVPMKLVKGGRWGSPSSAVHIYARRHHRPDDSFICFGARFAVDVDTVRAHLRNGTATVVSQGAR